MRTIVSLPLALLSFGTAIGLYGSSTTNADIAKNNPMTTFEGSPSAFVAEVLPVSEESPAPVAGVTPQPEPNEILTQYLEDTMLKWVQLPDCVATPARCVSWEKVERESVDHARERFHSIARDVAQAAAVEKSAWPHDPLNGRMAEFVLGLAFMESRFREYVDNGQCNDIAWQQTEEGAHLTGIGGNCDFAKGLKMVLATSMWQIHADQGIILQDSSKGGGDSTSLWSAGQVNSEEVRKLIEEAEKVPRGLGNFVTKENIRGTENRLLAARTAWHLAHGALRASKFQNLCAYTGEWGDVCPKGEIRLKFATKWWEKHPLTLRKE